MTARMMVIFSGLTPLRRMVMTILVPTRPRIFSTASERVSPRTGLPSIWVIKSPGCTPARAAGVSSIGETTLTRPFSIETSMPRPPNSPRVWTCISLKVLASM